MMAKMVIFGILNCWVQRFVRRKQWGRGRNRKDGGRPPQHSHATELGIDAVKCKVTMGRRGRCRWIWIFGMDIYMDLMDFFFFFWVFWIGGICTLGWRMAFS